MWTWNNGDNVGEFTEQDYGKVFTYRKAKEHEKRQHLVDADADSEYNPYGLPYLVDVLDGTRFAFVKKTVAYVCVDEDADGQPVFERWSIKQHKIYAEM